MRSVVILVALIASPAFGADTLAPLGVLQPGEALTIAPTGQVTLGVAPTGQTEPAHEAQQGLRIWDDNGVIRYSVIGEKAEPERAATTPKPVAKKPVRRHYRRRHRGPPAMKGTLFPPPELVDPSKTD
jgi:hypothetical protein